VSSKPAGPGGRDFAQAMEDIGLEFFESIEEEPAIVALQQGHIEGWMPDDLDGGRDD